MDVQRYISSGIIENHVIGLVSEAENREMEVAIQQHPEVKAAVDAAQQDLEKYVMMMAQKPPVHLKKQILERLKQDAGAAEPAIPVTHIVLAALVFCSNLRILCHGCFKLFPFLGRSKSADIGFNNAG